MQRPLIFVLVAMVLFGSWQLARAADDVEKVEITYGHMGLGGRRSETITLTREGAAFMRQGAAKHEASPFSEERVTAIGREHVDAERVQALVDAARAKTMRLDELIVALTPEAWLNANATAAYDLVGGQQCSTEARRLFVRSFRDPVSTRAAMRQYFEAYWTDDYPGARVVIGLRNGQRIELESGGQHVMLVPWHQREIKNWNPAIPRAIAALLPPRSWLRERAVEDRLVLELARRVHRAIEARWEDFEMRCVHRDVIAALARAYRLAGIYQGSTGTFAAYLQSADMPANLAINAVFDVPDAKTAHENVAVLLQVGPVLARQVDKFARSQPASRFTIWVSNGVSFSTQDIDHRREPRFDRLRAVADKSALVREHDYYHGKEWVVLPDGEAVVWEDRQTFATRRPGTGW
jgi:hypothetical protein